MPTREQSKPAGFQSILCAVDFSPQSYAALQMAVEIAQGSGGRVTALCVEDPLLDAGAAASGYNTALLRKSTLAQLERLMKRMAEPAGLGRDAWQVESLFGTPSRTIVSLARRMSADLIAMGTNGRSGPAKLFFGSVANEVLRRAPAPVLVVARRRPRRGSPDARHSPVVGAIELGPDDREDARRMARAAAKTGGPLTLVHVVYRAPGLPASSGAFDPDYERRLAEARKRLDRLAASVGAASRVVTGRVEDEIGRAATDAKAGLIILALRKGRGIFGPRQGSTTYRLLCTSAIPVLALPPA